MQTDMARPSKFPERKLCTFRRGTLDRVDRLKDDCDDSTDAIREAVEQWCERQEKSETKGQK